MTKIDKNKQETEQIVKQNEIPKGKPKSGRIWKDENKRFSNLTIQTPNRSSWQKKMQAKQERKMVKLKEQEMKEEVKQKKTALRERQKLNEERRIENERRAEIVQLVKDPRKIKKIRKKQLRLLQKRDISKLKETNIAK